MNYGKYDYVDDEKQLFKNIQLRNGRNRLYSSLDENCLKYPIRRDGSTLEKRS